MGEPGERGTLSSTLSGPLSDHLICNAWICQVSNDIVRPVFGDLRVRNGQIIDIRCRDFRRFLAGTRHNGGPNGGQSTGKAAYGLTDDDTVHCFDVYGRVVTPPQVNFHHHLYSGLAAGLPASGGMGDFAHILRNLWWKLDRKLDPDMIEACAHLGVLESIRHGVTCIFDHHSSPAAQQGSLDILARVFRRHGLRGVLCFETSDRGGLQGADRALAENRRFAQNLADDHLKAMLGLHASFTLGDQTLKKAARLVGELDMGIHIHLCEDPLDNEESRRLHHAGPVKRLLDFNLLNSRGLLAHGVHLSEADYRALVHSGAAIVHNPHSNLGNAVGLPLYRQIPAPLPILMGTDGMHADIAQSMKLAYLLYRHQGNDPAAATRWIQKIYFDQIRFMGHYFPDFSQLRVGDPSDLVVWDYVPATPFSGDNFWGHFIHGILESPVHSVMQRGKFLLKDHRLQIPGDVQRLRARIHEQGERLVAAFGGVPGHENEDND